MLRPNLILRNTCKTESYTAPQAHSKKQVIARNPEKHAERLCRQLHEALAESKSRSAQAMSESSGTYIEFSGQHNKELLTKSLENRREGIRLLNIRQQDETTYATVYVPSGKENFFLKRIKSYADASQLTEKGNRHYEQLVASIEDIGLAIVESMWTGRKENMPTEKRGWLEVWLRTDQDENGKLFESYAKLLDELSIKHRDRYILFPERMVTLVFANIEDLSKLLARYDRLAEFREASIVTSSFYANLDVGEQGEWIKDLLSRTTFEPGQTSICIVDTGVNRGNPLLTPIVDRDVVLTVDDSFSKADNDNHGTRLAGLAVYDDLKEKLTSDASFTVTHTIESMKLLDLSHPNEDPDLYGELAKQAIDRVYIKKPDRKRLFCSAVTARDDEITDGLPNSWSAALDEEIAHSDDPGEEHELFLISAGNVTLPMLNEAGYPDANITHAVRTPGQSWNALTVGAYSDAIELEEEGIVNSGFMPATKMNELSPFSTTSLSWKQAMAPIKPEIVCPGGNVIVKNGTYSDCQDLSLLTTGAQVLTRPLDTVNATSAAVAKAAYIAAEIENAYPDLWPETVRGLIVHSARWSDEMIARFCPKNSPENTKSRGRRILLRTCGYGIPSLSRAIECRENSVNMIIQGSLQPFAMKNGKDSMNEMHFHRLPWPKEVLQELGEADAILHVTLSYYIEPGPGEIGWKDKYRYASYGLRFDVNNPDEDLNQFEHRINVDARKEDEGRSVSESRDWLLGKNNRNVGSIHSDYKYTSAVDLSSVEYIAVYPVIGWWRSRKYLGKINSIARYALIVSVETPTAEAELYTAIKQQIANEASAQIVV